MSAEIHEEGFLGVNGNPEEEIAFRGSGFTGSKTVSANTITVDGEATTHKEITIDSNGDFPVVTVTITDAISTAGQYDIVVPYSDSGSETFSSYLYVTEGCGLNDIWEIGDLDHSDIIIAKAKRAIRGAKRVYDGAVYGHVSGTPHTLGEYPQIAIDTIATIAVARLWMSKGSNKEYRERAQAWKEEAKEMILDIINRRTYLYKPDGTLCTFSECLSSELPNHTGSFGVLDSYEEEEFDI